MTTVSVWGELVDVQGRVQLKVSGTRDILALVPDPKNPGAYTDASKKLGQTVIIQGLMMPGRDLKALVPIQVSQMK